MKKIFLFAIASVALASCSNDNGSVTIKLPDSFTDSTLVVNHVLLDNMFNAKRQEDLIVLYDTLQVKDHVAKMKLDQTGAARYDIYPIDPTTSDPEFYAVPGDKLEVTINDFNPLDYKVTGSKLMEDMTALSAVTSPIQEEYLNLLRNNDNINPELVKDIMNRYEAAIKKFVADNPQSEVIPFAIINLDIDDFKPLYDNMSDEAKKSILMPFADAVNTQVTNAMREREAEDARKAEIASGKITAPNFTLPDLNGKKVSLSDFRGKWVVLDFWGSWCGWCVKGFPALKDAYSKYGDKIVIIGIDCNESEADWRAGVKQHELPWINLYNGDNKTLYQDYSIQGFPTKAIINPEGKIVDITSGEDPTFFNRLADFVK